jgi:hypothetical protein
LPVILATQEAESWSIMHGLKLAQANSS